MLIWIEPDAHRQALNDLDVVAGCVLWWQYARAIAGRGGHILDVTSKIFPALLILRSASLTEEWVARGWLSEPPAQDYPRPAH
jgi:hypothetical protein